MVSKKSKNETRQKRHLRLRKTIIGSATCPRLVVFKSNTNIYAQIIDDSKGVTLVAASSIDKELKLENGSNIAAAAQVGELVGKRAVKAGIETVVFDRGGYLYHGRVKALADAAREAGLRF